MVSTMWHCPADSLVIESVGATSCKAFAACSIKIAWAINALNVG